MMTLLILAVIVLGILAVTRLSRVYELTSALRGKREEDITERDSRMNARLMWAFPFAYFAFFLWLTVAYADQMLPVSASEHGVWLDDLLNFNWAILIVAFFVTNVLLFYFAGKYYYRKDRRAYFYPHNSKWELGWTIVPAIVMIGIIIYGLSVWNRITSVPLAGTPQVELYAQQFNWTARYPGKDGKLGATDFRLISGTNALGVVTPNSIKTRLAELEEIVVVEKKKLETEGGFLPPSKLTALEDHIKHVERMRGRIVNLRTLMDQDIAARGAESPYNHGSDDIVIKEFHLPVRENVDLVIRSQDVIHSVFLPHLRAQMNAVPGMATRIHMKPTITTDSMRTITANPVFDYILMCNKICGASHYNMQMPLTVEPDGAYKVWLSQQKGFETAEIPAAEVVPATDTAAVISNTTANIPAVTNEPKKN
ncbi:MAG: cytochrome c oxidase subunit II [Flavobacteriales bacterium]|nr:cytochrome c oxidase subunit II [Flavobacteriales bacterium]